NAPIFLIEISFVFDAFTEVDKRICDADCRALGKSVRFSRVNLIDNAGFDDKILPDLLCSPTPRLCRHNRSEQAFELFQTNSNRVVNVVNIVNVDIIRAFVPDTNTAQLGIQPFSATDPTVLSDKK